MTTPRKIVWIHTIGRYTESYELRLNNRHYEIDTSRLTPNKYQLMIDNDYIGTYDNIEVVLNIVTKDTIYHPAEHHCMCDSRPKHSRLDQRK